MNSQNAIIQKIRIMLTNQHKKNCKNKQKMKHYSNKNLIIVRMTKFNIKIMLIIKYNKEKNKNKFKYNSIIKRKVRGYLKVNRFQILWHNQQLLKIMLKLITQDY